MSCDTNKALHPTTGCNEDQGPLKKVAFVKMPFKFASLSLAMEYANWETAIQNEDIFILPDIANVEAMDTDDLYDETSYRKMKTASGKKGFKISYDANLDLNAKLQSFESNGGYGVFLMYESGLIEGCKTRSMSDFKPMRTSFTNAENFKPNSFDKVSTTIMTFELKDQKEMNDFGLVSVVLPQNAVIPWDYTQLASLKSIVLEIVSATATKIIFKAYELHIANGAGVKIATQGLVSGDVALTKTDGSAQTITTMPPTVGVAGQYEVNGTGLISGFLALKLPSLMLTKGYAGYEPAMVTIP